MENNLNQEGIEEYCQKFSDNLINKHFVDHQVITGPQILELQDIKQVNLFVMKNLLAEWKNEAAKIRSPYFNYNTAEVKEAQKEFMNVLSRHITIDKENFDPLLRKATRETLILIFSPYDYYTHLIYDQNKNDLSIEQLKRIAKYVKINKNLLSALIEKAESEGHQSMTREDASHLLNDLFENIQETPEDVDIYMEKFSKVEPLNQDIIYGKQQKPEKQEKGNATPEQEEKIAPKVQINSRFDLPKKILNDHHSDEKKPTLSDLHRNQKIESIRKNLSINQKFMFINTLFDGNEESFNKTIDLLETFEDKNEAISYLNEEHPNWDKESEEVGEFMEVVDKRLD